MKNANRKAMFATKTKYPIKNVLNEVRNNEGKLTLKQLYQKYPKWAVTNLHESVYIKQNSKGKMVSNLN